jgi:hypothetical protein
MRLKSGSFAGSSEMRPAGIEPATSRSGVHHPRTVTARKMGPRLGIGAFALCGAYRSGTRGDCYLAVESGPLPDSSPSRQLVDDLSVRRLTHNAARGPRKARLLLFVDVSRRSWGSDLINFHPSPSRCGPSVRAAAPFPSGRSANIVSEVRAAAGFESDSRQALGPHQASPASRRALGAPRHGRQHKLRAAIRLPHRPCQVDPEGAP